MTLHTQRNRKKAGKLRKEAHVGRADWPSKQNQGVKGDMMTWVWHPAEANPCLLEGRKCGLVSRILAISQGLAHCRWTLNTGEITD